MIQIQNLLSGEYSGIKNTRFYRRIQKRRMEAYIEGISCAGEILKDMSQFCMWEKLTTVVIPPKLSAKYYSPIKVLDCSAHLKIGIGHGLLQKFRGVAEAPKRENK